MTVSELKSELCGRISEQEWVALEAGEGLCISGFNRGVMLRLRDWPAAAEGRKTLGREASETMADREVPEAAVEELTADLEAYLSEYMGDRPEGHKWIIIACLFLTFIERVPMHPQEAAHWQFKDGRYVCPSCDGSIICGYCMCQPQIPEAAPEEVGVSSRSIISYMDRVQEEGIRLHAFQMARHGRLIADAVARPYTHGSFHRIYSAAKGIVATAVLLCIQDGLYTFDEPVIKYFPKEWIPEDLDPRWERLTLYHLLTMTAGHSKDTMFSMLMGKSPCWVRTFFEIKPDYEPGTHFVYDMGVQYVMNELVRLAVGKDLGQFMDERIFRPMGIKAQWCYTPIEGIFWSSSMQLQPDGLTKLSLLYLQEGEWNGVQLVDRELMRFAMRQHVPSRPAFPERKDREDMAGYGLHMWRNSFGGLRFSGGQGQYGVIVPEYDMVCSTLAADSRSARLLDIFYEEVLRKCSERPLPPDPEGYAELKARMEGFGLGPQNVEKTGRAASEVSGKTYYFEDNAQGQKSVRFDFEEDRAVITTESLRGTKRHVCGLGGEWLENTGYLLIDKEDGDIVDLDRIFYYDEKQTCLTGGWKDDETFVFKLRGPAMLCDYTFVCRFGEGTVDIELSSTCHEPPSKRMGEPAKETRTILHGVL